MMRKIFWTTAIAAFVLDQLSKIWVVHWLNLKTIGEIEVFPPYLVFHMAWNRGVNFGLFQANDAGRWILIALSIAICIWVFMWLRKEGGGAKAWAGAGLLIGGAMGNVIDRIIYGAVADFLNMSCCGFDNPFAFNIADAAIFLGAIMLILFSGNPKKQA